MEMEERVLLPLLTSAIDAMAKQLGTMHVQACRTRTATTTSELQCEAFVDMDAYLAVARSLLHGKPVAASSKEVRAIAVAHSEGGGHSYTDWVLAQGEELANEWRQAAEGSVVVARPSLYQLPVLTPGCAPHATRHEVRGQCLHVRRQQAN